ncbi:putative membrane protein [Rhodobium orientis]|uniref:DUF4870 domain-containing protein n=1 Tax=Rhodobium orientis TaxID=34017 RepID=A0A327JNK3_9HYPH|nr:hypothetical protein [Rhodobium orientis]MBB4304153.1 putative membrane protein [Rhodobium orientis]MBK5950624.1 hypothetical protein [Rhodobium orientis]RAI28009.1 hypothetical protein CH339_07850 [Rhodobium orientis]
MSTQGSDDLAGYMEPGAKNVTLIYILYLVGFVLGITPLIGVVIAYMNRGRGGWPDTHYTFQIRTFWISLLAAVVAFLLAFVGIGFLLMIVIAVWVIIRCIKGLQAASRDEPIPDPQTWVF